MRLDRVIAVRNSKTVYRDGDKCVKVFNSEYSKSDVLNEALNQARAEELSVNVPRVWEVAPTEEKWAIVSDYIRGKTLARLIEEEPDNKTWTGDRPGGGPPPSLREVGEEKVWQDPSRE